MLALNLSIADWPILLTGQGSALDRRIALVRVAGAKALSVRRYPDLPDDDDISASRVLFVAGLSPARATQLAATARAHRVLVNVEDVPELCDFHVPALVRRGDLTLAISTCGRGPGLAGALRRRLERQFDTEWADHLLYAEAERRRLRDAGEKPGDIARAMEHMVAAWLPP